ncbi:MAG: transglycosylase SLT domain-containing protein [Desulfobulbaceae bacterium]|nr:transglycosylase SLT domain-containing protein [Desulfobulbaceae bacterium]
MNHYPTTYDPMFQAFTACFFADLPVDWQWLKAQAIAESGLDPLVVSPDGARGIMQIMPSTWAELRAALNLPDDPFDPHLSIKAGVYYAARLYRVWRKERGMERLRFMWASYNAGLGNILKAQRLASKPDTWASLAEVLPLVTGWDDAPETIKYIKNIEKIREELT